ncbi:MAG: hypothetical protein VKP62_15320, partial [Candidatus Sericytochromatia bacterium]|nr:hypothetical protein [Candidatus Sericytochromatia bacterium]
MPDWNPGARRVSRRMCGWVLATAVSACQLVPTTYNEQETLRLRAGTTAAGAPVGLEAGRRLVLESAEGPLPDGTRVRFDDVDMVIRDGALSLTGKQLAARARHLVAVEGFEPLEVDLANPSVGRLRLVSKPSQPGIAQQATMSRPGSVSPQLGSQLPAPDALRLADLRLTAGGHLKAGDGLTRLAAQVAQGDQGLSLQLAGEPGGTRPLSDLLTAPGSLRYDTARGAIVAAGPLAPAGPGAQSGAAAQGGPGLATSLFGTVKASGLVAGPSVTGSAAGMIGMDGATLKASAAGGLVGLDGATMIADRGNGLIGLDGSTLVGDRRNGLIGLDGATLIGPQGSGLIGLDVATLIGQDASTLIGQDGATLRPGTSGMAAMAGYPYFPAQMVGLAKFGLLSELPAVPLQRDTAGGVTEMLWPEQTLVRALDLEGNLLTAWVFTQSSGGFTLALPAALPPVFVVQAQTHVPNKKVLRGCGLAFAPGVEHRPLLIPLDTASTMVTCDILFLLDYTPKE